MLSTINKGLTVAQRQENKSPVIAKPGFNPINIGDLALWIDFSDLSSLTIDANGINTANDKSGNGNHLTQIVNANKPQSIIGQNNKYVADFDGIDDFLSRQVGTVGFANTNSSITIFLVYLVDKTSGFRFEIRNANSNGHGINENTGLNSSYYLESIGWQNSTFPFLPGVYTIDNIIYDSLNGSKYYRGNILGLNSPLLSVNVNVINQLWLGTLVGINYFNGKICEWIVYNKTLNNIERTLVYNYLAAKWAL